MKVCAAIGPLEGPELGQAVAAHIREDWPQCTVVSDDAQVPAGTEALLTVGTGPDRIMESILLVERLESQGPLDNILFQIDAKLGKLTHSDLVKTKVSFISDANRRVSRRELFNFRGGFQIYSDVPFVFTERCDARHGCSRCVEVCPVQSLHIVGGSVAVNEADCVRCGLCAENCPTSAIQLPRFSEEAFLGLLDGLNVSDAPKKTLVLTCKAGAVKIEPWMCVEEVNDVGVVGPRHLALAASSSVGAIAVYCADGRCVGKEKARAAVELIRYISGDEGAVLTFAEGPSGISEVMSAHALSRPPKEPMPFARNTWASYVNALRAIAREDASAAGLRLTKLVVSEACTLCGVCARECPHSALKTDAGVLSFDPANCTGCSHCVSVCPERAISLGNLPILSDLRETAVSQDEVVPCARCGKPLESARLLKKVVTLLGREDPMMKYCNDCKQRLAFESLLKRKGQGGT